MSPRTVKIFIRSLFAFLLFNTVVSCSFSNDIKRPEIKKISQAELDSIALIYVDSQRNEQVHEFMTKLHRNGAFNGNVLVAEGSKIIYQNSFGFANYLLKDSLTLASKFELASVSKPLTAMGILKLVEKEKLDLSQTVNDFYPSFPYPDITIEHLLSHQSGLPNYLYALEKIWPDQKVGMTNQEAVELLIQHKPNRYGSPGGRYQYSNTNYMLLAAIIEKITGQDFSIYMKEEIFEPARMFNTQVLSKALYEKIPTDVIGHDRTWRYSVVQNYLDGPVGDKGIYSTIHDLYLFDRALRGGRVIDTALLNASYMKRTDVSRNGLFGYGYGWRVFDHPDHPVVYHTGWWHGFKSLFVRDITQNKTIILLTNMANGSLNHLDELYKIMGMPVIRSGAYDGRGQYIGK